MNALPEGFRAVVFGASGAIGAALVQALQAEPRCGQVIGLSRGSTPPLDLDDAESMAACARWLQPQGPVHLFVDATGALHLQAPASAPGSVPASGNAAPDRAAAPTPAPPLGAGRTIGPEKRLADLDANTLARAFAVNAIGPALLLKHFHDLMPTREPAIFATLSARVGSIGDNRKGGWYGYRAAKAALNQLWRTASIETARRRPLSVLVALHPGTVQSALTAPVIGADAPQAQQPAQAAARLLSVLGRLTPADNGSFLAYDGQTIPW